VLGLLATFVCLGLFPAVLMRLGWVPARRRRPKGVVNEPPQG
jgi:hypothetical protein